MKTQKAGMIMVAWIIVLGASSALAQRGTGEDRGLAERGIRPEMVEIQGRLTALQTGPCKNTTGREYVGTHLLIRTDDGRDLNVHVGSAAYVQAYIEQLQVGEAIRATVFRTDRHPEHHYVAKTLTAGDETLVVRRENLQPYWASQPRPESRFHRRPERGRGY